MNLLRRLWSSNALGMALAMALVLGLSAWLLWDAERHRSAELEQRLALVEANALASTLALAPAESVGEILGAWRARDPRHETAILISGTELLGSARAEDGAPRRLTREEKPLYDLANLIRGARETNLGEGVVRKKLAYFGSGPGEGGMVTVPYLSNGEFAGILQVRIRPDSSATSPASSAMLWLGLLLAATAIGAAVRARDHARPDLPRLLLLVAFAGMALFYQQERVNDHLDGVEAGTRQVAEAVRAAASHGMPASADNQASPWDTDAYLRPLGVILADGRIDTAKERTRATAQTRLLERSLWAVSALGLLLLAAFALGYMGRLGRTLRAHAEAYAYVTPAMLGMLILVFFPFLYGITLAFTDTTLFNESQPFSERWIGFENFVTILGDFNLYERGADGVVWNYQNFYWTLMVTVIWTVSNVTIGVTLGFILAMILNTEDLRGKAIYRVILILPWAIPNYITALVWRGMFHPQFGVINQVLQMLGMAPVAWFDGVVSSFLTGLATNGWLSFPFMMVVILGALQSIPKDMYEAAEVEGASRWQRLRHITLPLLRPTLIPAIVLSVVWTFNMFNIIFLVSGGEPAGANEILITKAYKIAFENYQYAYAAAYSTVIFIILLVYGVFQTRVTKATESF